MHRCSSLDINLLAVLNPNTTSPTRFGYAVSTSADTIVLGDYFDDRFAYDAGVVYVLVRDGTSWIQQAYLKASNTEDNNNFGYSVSISEDTIVVGANQESSNATGVNRTQTKGRVGGSGAAYVFVRDGTSWAQQAYLKGSNTEAGDYFGYSVGVRLEDSNATGVNGTQNNDLNNFNSGAAYVFVRDGSIWAQHTYLKANVFSPVSQFGIAVAIDEFIVVGEDDSATVFGKNNTMDITTGTTATTATTATIATTATTGSTGTSATTSTVDTTGTRGTTVSTGDVMLYTSGTITDHTTTTFSSTADGSTCSQTNTTNSLTLDSVNSNREKSEVDGNLDMILIIVGVIAGVLVVCGLIAPVIFVVRRRKSNSKDEAKAGDNYVALESIKCK
jgi:hypothetical protein